RRAASVLRTGRKAAVIGLTSHGLQSINIQRNLGSWHRGDRTAACNWERRMRFWLLLIFAFVFVPASGVSAQTSYPDRPIKMIVPLAAASAVDVAARIVTQKMADNMGQQIVILNLPGASGLIGAEQVARAEPDGYTIGGFNDSVMTM